MTERRDGMIILSNDSMIIHDLYEKMAENGENVTLRKKAIQGALGYEEFIEWLSNVKLEVKVDVDLTKIIVTFINRYYDFKTQKLILEKSNGSKKVIDTGVLEEGKAIERLNVKIDNDDIIHIETKDA